MTARYQYIAERTIRCRSVSIKALKPHRFLWVATFWAQLHVWFTGEDAILYREHEVPGVLDRYRNWMSQNRVTS